MGNDTDQEIAELKKTISIHVPAWGTTLVALAVAALASISIHVPAWGTTITLWEHLTNTRISIHVPAWGTTVFSLFYLQFK